MLHEEKKMAANNPDSDWTKKRFCSDTSSSSSTSGLIEKVFGSILKFTEILKIFFFCNNINNIDLIYIRSSTK